MKFLGEVLLFLLFMVIVIAPACGTTSQGSFSIDVPNMKFSSITDDQGNTAHTITMVQNGNCVSTGSSNTEDGASVEQNTRATGSVIFARSVAIDAGGNLAETQSVSAGHASMDTQQTAEANDSGATAGQDTSAAGLTVMTTSGASNGQGNRADTNAWMSGKGTFSTRQTAGSDDTDAMVDQDTSMDLQEGSGYAGTSAQGTEDEMHTNFSIKGTGTVSTVQSGASGTTPEQSTMSLKQRSSLSLVKGQAHTRLSAPNTLWTVQTEEDFYDGVNAESDQQVDRITNATDFRQNTSSSFTGETGDGRYQVETSIIFDNPPLHATDHMQVDLQDPRKYTVKKLSEIAHNFPTDDTVFSIDTVVEI